MGKKLLIGIVLVVIFVSLGIYKFPKKDRAIIIPPAIVTQEKVSQGNPAENVEQNIKQVEPKDFVYVPNVCAGKTYQFECYQAHYQTLVQEKDVATAFVDIKKRYDEDMFVKSSCHQLSHVIGRAAFLRYSKVSETYVHGDSFCWSGYYHGAIEATVSKYGREEFPKQMDIICNDIPGKNNYSFEYYNCVHGMGHAAMVYTENQLFDSLKLCDNLSGGWEQTSCYGGVFMENIMVDNKNHLTIYLKADDPIYPCNAVENAYKSSCFMMQTSYMLKVSGQDFKKVFSLCSQVEAGYRATCYQSLGRDASGQSVSSVEPTKNTCALGVDYEQKSNCIIGAVKDFISYYHSDVQAKEFCNALSSDLQQICKSTAEAYYKSF